MKKKKDGDRHTTPRVVFHLPEEYLEFLDYIRKPSRRTRTAEILLALESHFDHYMRMIDKGVWPPAEEKHDSGEMRDRLRTRAEG